MAIRSFRCFALATSLALSACAYGTRTVRLGYPPRGEVEPTPTPTPVGRVVLLPLGDRRPEPRDVIAWTYSGIIKRHVGDVVTPTDLRAWADTAIRTELERAEIEVLPSPPDLNGPDPDAELPDRARGASAQGSTMAGGDPMVGGDLLRVNCEYDEQRYRAQVVIRSWVYRDQAFRLHRVYSGQIEMRADGLGLMSDDGFGRSCECALQDAARKIAADVRRGLAR